MTELLQLQLFGRVLVAAICGGLIGYERRNANKEAGVRTHLIVCLASALFMIVSQYGFLDVILRFPVLKVDVSRVAAQVVSGIGFLGAGMIFVRHGLVNGLTTAAGIWATSAVGLTIGSGLYVVGISSVFLLYFFQRLLQHKRMAFLRPTKTVLAMQVVDVPDLIPQVRLRCQERAIPIAHLQYEKIEQGANTALLSLELLTKSNQSLVDLAEVLEQEDYVISVEL